MKNKSVAFFRNRPLRTCAIYALVFVQQSCCFGQTASAQTEAERFLAIKKMIQHEKIRRLNPELPEKSVGFSQKNAPTCDELMSDLLQGHGFEPVEPIKVISTQEQIETDKANQICQTAEANGDEDRAQKLFTGWNNFAGAPPYRIYRLPEQIDPFQKAGLFFWSNYETTMARGMEYRWVDLAICEYASGVPTVAFDASRIQNDPDGQLTALTQYKKALAVWSVSRNSLIQVTLLYKQVKAPASEICTWTVYTHDTNVQ